MIFCRGEKALLGYSMNVAVTKTTNTQKLRTAGEVPNKILILRRYSHGLTFYTVNEKKR